VCPCVKPFASFSKLCFVQVGLESSNQVSGFQKSFGLFRLGLSAVVIFQILLVSKLARVFYSKSFAQICSGSKIGFKVLRQSFGKQAISFCKVRFFLAGVLLVKSGSQNRLHFFSKGFCKCGSGFFLPGLFFLAK